METMTSALANYFIKWLKEISEDCENAACHSQNIHSNICKAKVTFIENMKLIINNIFYISNPGGYPHLKIQSITSM